jgi:hypothetical protein
MYTLPMGRRNRESDPLKIKAEECESNLAAYINNNMTGELIHARQSMEAAVAV